MYDKKAVKKYRNSIKGKITINKYENSIKVKEYRKNYNHSNNGRQLSQKRQKKYSIKNPEKRIAKQKLNNLFISGNIPNDFICGICGKQPIEKHHENYNLWYSFIPLCIEHHNIIHNIKGV